MNANELAQEFEEYLKSIEELPWGNYEVLCNLAVTKLRQQQESIEGLTRDYDLLFAEHQLLRKKEWVGLTDEEAMQMDIDCDGMSEWLDAIEAKLKQKNGYTEEKNT